MLVKVRKFFYLFVLVCALSAFSSPGIWKNVPHWQHTSVILRDQNAGGPDSDPLVLEDDAQSTSGPIPPLNLNLRQTQVNINEGAVLDVPAYIWYHGCGPTAVGMVLGYWDAHGFDQLIPGNAQEQTEAVNQAISSSGNYYDYCKPIDNYGEGPSPRPDLSEAPLGDEHADNSIADFMQTSQSAHQNYYGWSWYSKTDDAFTGYVHSAAPDYFASAVNLHWGAFSWEIFTAEIDAGRPVVLLVDSNEDGYTDHFITAIGYGEADGKRMYASHNTWDIGIHWYEFKPMTSGQLYGIYGATLFNIRTFSKLAPETLSDEQFPYIRLKWEAINTDGEYEYCVDTLDNNACDTEWVSAGDKTQAMLYNLELDTTYYWNVRYSSSSGTVNANEGNWWQFTTQANAPSYYYLPVISTSH